MAILIYNEKYKGNIGTVDLIVENTETKKMHRFRAKKPATKVELGIFLAKLPTAHFESESTLRLAVIPFVESRKTDDWIMLNGNSVWNIKVLVRDMKRLLKKYDPKSFTEYLYQFFSLQCGSIAHYNKIGWFDEYPTPALLRSFFVKNELGQPVKGYAPVWHTDARLAQQKLDDLFYGKE